MDFRAASFDAPLIHTIHHLMDLAEEAEKSPSMAYVRDANAMAATLADVVETRTSYVFIVDVPGQKSGDIRVEVEEEDVLVITGERKREEEKEGTKYLKMERRVGKVMRKFLLPENVNADAVTAVCHDGVLRVTVEKVPPKKPRTVEVKVG